MTFQNTDLSSWDTLYIDFYSKDLYMNHQCEILYQEMLCNQVINHHNMYHSAATVCACVRVWTHKWQNMI
jgi:hypothetical protein